MKIICIGNNYAEGRYLNKLEEPYFFIKPETALLQNRNAFFIPDHTKQLGVGVELVVKINRLGKHIGEKFANKYYDEIGLGISFVALDVLAECKLKGLPFDGAWSFDGSSPKGNFKTNLKGKEDLDFELKVNNQRVMASNLKNMIYSIDKLIALISERVTLKIGDLIYTGTPEIYQPIGINDELVGMISTDEMISVVVK